MYNIGTVTTTANSTKLIGVGTKWKENINLVLPMQSLQVQIGNTVYNNSIHSIQSNTELTLNFPLPTAQAGAKYVIFTTTMDSISAAANAIVAMNVSNVQFSDIQNRIMTESGVIDIKLPDGTVRKTRTEAERDKLLDGKLNATVPEAIGSVIIKNEGNYPSVSLRKNYKNNGERVDIETALDTSPMSLNIVYRDKDGKNVAVVSVPKKTGTLMQVGDHGVGVAAPSQIGMLPNSGFVSYSDSNLARQQGWPGNGCGIQSVYAGDRRFQLHSNTVGGLYNRFSMTAGADTTTVWYEIYSTKNTTKDSNGNLKAASPIVKVFADHIELNEESEGVELKKLYTGIYQLHGTLGMHSDASWGGIHGGLEIPEGINKLPLVYADYDVLFAGELHPFTQEIVTEEEHGDIVIYTNYRKHSDLPPNMQRNRLETYPEFTKEANGETVELEAGAPCDIPNGHWIDVRVNMPSNSIYNLKQAEAERLAKEAAEKQAEEDAKRAAEEAEQVSDI